MYSSVHHRPSSTSPLPDGPLLSNGPVRVCASVASCRGCGRARNQLHALPAPLRQPAADLLPLHSAVLQGRNALQLKPRQLQQLGGACLALLLLLMGA